MVQACLPGWAAAVCYPGCRVLPGAGQRKPPCHQGLMAWVPLQLLRSLGVQRARADTSSYCEPSLLPRKRQQKAMEEKCQVSASGPSQCCPPTDKHTRVVSFVNEEPWGFRSLLLQSNGD